ncbi:MAG TPA: tRNA uridine-5-carboxymethylaminomethyl(34) synthesis GTPase MnmE, partial [Betaproteobacteria bacterium]|nr:tRNA uridine-5-carboxymethylaminomethyl(34) synthesis GTPase MnmE [Betaproteobacteria bacterium]
NVGKSSLLNRLAGEEIAIVTDVAGTTRDTIQQPIQINGVPVHIIDTAGLRDAQDEVEKIGIARAWRAIEKADVGLLLMDITQGAGEGDREILKRLPEKLKLIRVFNKIDVVGLAPKIDKTDESLNIYLSAKTGEGIALLRQGLLDIVGWKPSGEGVFIARERHLLALTEAHDYLQRARNILPQWEFFAEELRHAQNALNQITGAFTADDLLGEIFSRFCIGK